MKNQDLKPGELAYIVAAVGRVSNPLKTELYEKLFEQLTPAEMFYYHKFYETMEFGK